MSDGSSGNELEALRARVAELESADGELAQLQDKFISFTRDSAFAYYELDMTGDLTFANRRASEITGYEVDELAQMNIAQFIDEETLARAQADLMEAALTPNTGIREYELKAKDGTSRFVESNAVPIMKGEEVAGFQCTLIDVTARKAAERERQRLEEERRQSQKLEAIGTLAGGIAHDFNNLLTGILAYASMLKRDESHRDDVRRAATIMERAAKRGAELTGQLLSFARKGKLQTLPVNLNGMIEDVVAILARTIEKSIAVEEKLDASPSHVLGDPSQLQQVVLNLAVNARDAMPDGGCLRLETEVLTHEGGDRREHGELEPGTYVVMTVSDTGTGIPEEVQGRMFEPFFTTKGKEGTGMGLPVVYGIVKSHGGRIEVDSEPGEGTTFKVYLPASAAAPRRTTETIQPMAMRKHCRVLLVEDEEIVQSAAHDVLIGLGCEVTMAEDGVEALEVYRDRGADIDVVLMDLMMPRMNGVDCLRALREINPQVRVVATTGAAPESVIARLAEEKPVPLLWKPYSWAALSSAMAKVMSSEDES
jgi:PAS domain S-box-containing protein